MSSILSSRSFRMLVMMVDLVLIFLAYVLAFILRYDIIPKRNWHSFLALSPWILLISLFFLSVYDLFSLNRKSSWDIISSILVAVTFTAFITMSASFIFREFALPRTVIMIAYFLSILLLTGWKISFKKWNQKAEKGHVLLIGDITETERLMVQIKSPLLRGTKVKHIQPNTPVERIYQMINQVDYVMISPNMMQEKKSKIIYHSMKNGKIVYVIPTLYDLLLSKSIITSLDDTMVMAVKPFGLSLDQQIIKRLFDIIVSSLMLIIIMPVLLVTALLIKLEDPKGSILYKQKRIGKDNKEFTIYKFRSMIEGAENLTGPVLAEKNDHRITRVGRFIRLTRIDELPQLYNVLRGDMSIVGPRPEREFFIQKFAKELKSYHYRNTVKPGITGYAQIMGKYTTDVQDKLMYDLYYIRNYSLWLDIVILLRTVIVLMDKTKAEGRKSKTTQCKAVVSKRI
jgi:exopolysaccharide biosynthesis polyprenyl glycosylphosphotransferase